MTDPEREPAYITAAIRIRGRKVGFDLEDDAARLLAVVMTLCTVLVGAEALAGIAWLIAQVV